MDNITTQNKVLIGALLIVIALGAFMLLRILTPRPAGEPAPQIAETPAATGQVQVPSEPIRIPEPEERARVVALMETWPTSPDFHDGFYALAPMLSNAPSGATAIKFDPQDEYWGLPREPGYEEVEGYCSACHSLEIVMQQKLTPARWGELLIWMREKQGMPEPEPEDYVLILNYLQTNFGAEILAQP